MIKASKSNFNEQLFSFFEITKKARKTAIQRVITPGSNKKLKNNDSLIEENNFNEQLF